MQRLVTRKLNLFSNREGTLAFRVLRQRQKIPMGIPIIMEAVRHAAYFPLKGD